MFLEIEKLIILKDLALKAALEASEIIQSNFGKSVKAMIKNEGSNLANSILTQTDLNSQKRIIDILEPSLKEYDLGILSEEELDDQSRFKKDYFWCIDPLDGTLNFAKGIEGYSVSIALVSKIGETIIGIVVNPSTKDTYTAIKDAGAYKNNQRLIIKNKFKIISILTDHNKHINKVEGFKIQPPAGAVMNAINTVEMAPAIYFKLPKDVQGGGSLWDFAATSLIQSEAGGYNSDYNKKDLRMNKKNTFMNEEGIIYVSSTDLLVNDFKSFTN
jgi:fructose-1,6-bisphosphatase/inositol monophosphatase family enzyme